MVKRTNLQNHLLRARDILLLRGPEEKLSALREEPALENIKPVSDRKISEHYRLEERLMLMRVPELSILLGQSLRESRLGDALSMRVLSILRKDQTVLMPGPEDRLMAGDRLIVLGKLDDFNILQGLEELEIDKEIIPDMIDEMETEQVGLVEAMLAPHSQLAGMTLRQLHGRHDAPAASFPGKVRHAGTGDMARGQGLPDEPARHAAPVRRRHAHVRGPD
jgi:uncharacterized protein with PhoU and TrkA domain